MKVNQILDLVADNSYIYFGTQKGTNWIWICKKKELEEQMERCDSILYKNKQEELARRKKVLPKIEADIVQAQQELQEIWLPFRKAKKKNEPLKQKIDAKRTVIKHMEERHKEVQERITCLEKQIKDGVHMMDRNVVEIVPHTRDMPGLGVLVEGDESGKYWSLSEIEVEMKREAAIDNLYYTVKKAG